LGDRVDDVTLERSESGAVPLGVEVRAIVLDQTTEVGRWIVVDGDAVEVVTRESANTSRNTFMRPSTLDLVGMTTFTSEGTHSPYRRQLTLEPERGIEPLTYALRVRCSAD
jgi:hypothetical protein